MITSFFINSLDTINIIYLWAILNKKNNSLYRLLFSIITCSILVTAVEYFELNFILSYIVLITGITITCKKS